MMNFQLFAASCFLPFITHTIALIVNLKQDYGIALKYKIALLGTIFVQGFIMCIVLYAIVSFIPSLHITSDQFKDRCLSNAIYQIALIVYWYAANWYLNRKRSKRAKSIAH